MVTKYSIYTKLLKKKFALTFLIPSRLEKAIKLIYLIMMDSMNMPIL